MKQIKLLWVIAHEPAYLFYRVAEDFQKLVNRYKDIVNVEIEILTNSEYNKKYNPDEPVDRHNLWKLLQDGTVQITQMQTTSLSRQFNKQMHVLDMPFLFDTHDQVQTVLEGKVGQYLLNNFDNSSRLKGLAFTYSGGFRLMPFAGSVVSLDELVGESIRSGMSPIAQETIKAFGFTPVPTEIDKVTDAINGNQVVGAEHVAQRLFPDQCETWVNTIINTKHSIFLTSIVVNVDWWNSLDQQVQDIFASCAVEAARNERALSIQDGQESIDKLISNGVNFIDLDEVATQKLRKCADSVYEKFNDFFEAGLIDKIKH